MLSVGGSGGIVDGEDDDNDDDERQPLSINDSINKGSNGSIGLDEGAQWRRIALVDLVVDAGELVARLCAVDGDAAERPHWRPLVLLDRPSGAHADLLPALLSFSTLLQTTMSVLWCFDVGTERVLVAEPSEQCSGDRYGARAPRRCL
jgi:hypothetical protein